MSLKQLKLENELKRNNVEIEQKKEDLKKREKQIEELRTALKEAENEEDINIIEKEIEKVEDEEKETNQIKEDIEKLEKHIKEIEKELDEINKKSNEENNTNNTNNTNNKEEKRGVGMHKIQVREAIKNGSYYERAEVKEFYQKLKNIREIQGADLLIPEIIINRIMDIVGDYTTVYPLVDKVQAKGKGRIILDTDDKEASWLEQTGAFEGTDTGSLISVDFDGFKVGKAVFVANSLLEDSIINLDEYVCKKIARAIAKSLDKAILLGEGISKKQPLGIIPALSETNKKEVKNDLYEIVKNIALIDNGKDTAGEIVAVMKRSTYYNKILGYSINVDSGGNIVGKLPNIKTPDILGIPIIFNNYIEDNKILFGDFKKYTLVEREDISINNSKDYKFLEDQTTFLGKGRFDGKPVDKEAFVLITITDEVVTRNFSDGNIEMNKELENMKKEQTKLLKEIEKLKKNNE